MFVVSDYLFLLFELFLTSVEDGNTFVFLFENKFIKAAIATTTTIKPIDIIINFIFLINLDKIIPPFANSCNKIMGKTLELYNNLF